MVRWYHCRIHTCSVERVVVQCDGAEGKLHGSTRYSLVDHCRDGRKTENSQVEAFLRNV